MKLIETFFLIVCAVCIFAAVDYILYIQLETCFKEMVGFQTHYDLYATQCTFEMAVSTTSRLDSYCRKAEG